MSPKTVPPEATLVGLAILVIIIVAGIVAQNDGKREKQIRETHDLVFNVTERQIFHVEEVPSFLSEDIDAWGHPLRIEESHGNIWDSIEVSSDGPDGIPNTHDDIRKIRHSDSHLTKTGESVGKGVGDFGIGAVKGLYKSARGQIVSEPEKTEEP